MKSMQLRNQRRAVTATIVAALLGAAPAPAAECTAASGPERVAVLELYTSEGCDSCPPADQWVSALPARKFGGDRVIPLAFHVDYWNQLGWNDPFSQAAFSARQHNHVIVTAVLYIEVIFVLINGAIFWLIFRDKSESVPSPEEAAKLMMALRRRGG
jgi:hypothetical protein